MEALSPAIMAALAYLKAHAALFGVMALAYFVWPGVVTKIFKVLEDMVNKIKFTVGGVTVDFSTYDWDENVNHYLRDYVISLRSRATAIKDEVVAGGMDVKKGEEMLHELTDEVVDHFKEKAPEALRKYAEQKFGGDKLLAAEFLYRRVKGIVYDLNRETDKKKE